MRRWLAGGIVWFVLLAPALSRAQEAPATPVQHPQSEPTKPSPHPTSASTTPTNPDAQVWLNTHSGVYHCAGTHWYGVTKSGSYMKQSDAQQKGYRPAYHRPCK